MADAGNRAKAAGQPAVDLLVAGGGVMGLWTALFAARAGMSVCLAERRHIGAGASGGVLIDVYRAMLEHPRSREQEERKARQPFDFVVASLRALGVDAEDIAPLSAKGRMIDLAGTAVGMSVFSTDRGQLPLRPNPYSAAALERLGAATLSSDAVVHELYESPELKQLVRERWGDDVIAADGSADRGAIAASPWSS